MKKCLSAAVVLFIFLFFILSNAYASDVSRTKRHVAMVYDDSTSMYVSDNTKKPVLNWAYANYMTQAFLSLLSPRDSLYITYMSDTEKEISGYENLMEKDGQQAIDEIRSKNDYINKTPIASVETAYDMLKSLDEGLSDEYWLVIITDGEFTDYRQDITQKLLGYIDEMGSAGKTLKVVFLAIGDEAALPQADEENGLLVYRTGTNEIVHTMSALADNISGRHNVSPGRMSSLSGNRLSVDMLLPVRSLIVFTQADGNTLTGISNNKNEEMALSSSYNIKAPDEFKYTAQITAITDPAAVGAITRVNPSNEGQILSDGRYVLSFAEPADIDNIRVMYEPAIDIEVRYKSGGRTVENPEDGSVCDIEIVLVNALTGSPLNSKALPAEVECNIQIISGGKVEGSARGFTIEGVTLESGNLSVNTEVTMPGYFTLRNRHDYIYGQSPGAAPAATPPEHDETKGPWPPEVTLAVQAPGGINIDLKTLEESRPFIVIPYFNGEKGQLNDLQMGELQLICSRQMEFDVSIDETNMGFAVTPKYYGNIYSTSTGAFNVNFYFKSEYDKVSEAKLAFTVRDLSWFERNGRIIAIPFAALIAAVLIIGILVARKKFAKGAWLEFTQMQKSISGGWVASKSPSSASLGNLKGRWKMIPFAPERVNISNLLFFPASDDQYIIIAKKSLKPNMGTTRGALNKDELKSDFYLQSGHKFYMETGNQRLVFVYHGPKKSLLTKNKGKKNR